MTEQVCAYSVKMLQVILPVDTAHLSKFVATTVASLRSRVHDFMPTSKLSYARTAAWGRLAFPLQTLGGIWLGRLGKSPF